MGSRFRSIPYLLSQYAWLAIIAICAYIPFIITYNHETGQIQSHKNYESFNRSQIPGIFVHLSDIHIDHLQPEKTYFLDQATSLILNKIKPDFNVITGDLTNNYPTINNVVYSRQQPDDIRIYEAHSQQLRSKIPTIEIDGNHDVLAIYSYETKQNQASFYKNRTIEDYQIKEHTFEINGRNYTFIALNPFNFPTPHSPFIYYAHPETAFLDRFEQTIEKVPDANEIIVINHFPYFVWKFGPKSSSKKDMKKILKNKKIGFFLNGHLHPSKPMYMHYNGVLEIVGCDLKDHHTFSVAIVDNGRFSYHPINLIEVRENSTFGFVTNPLPDKLLSNHQIFNEKDSFVRMVVYSDKRPVINSSVFPDVYENRQLECRQINDENENLRFWLCETELHISEYGKYRLEIDGDFQQSIEFTIDDTLSSYKENIYEPLNTVVIRYEVYLAVIWFFLLIILFPFYRIPEEIRNKFDMWIEGESDDSMWIYSILLGFFAVKSRIDRLPNLIRLSLFVAVLWPICLPIIFVTIDKHLGFVWTYGYVCKGAHYGVWGQYFALMYLVGFVLPITLFCSALAISLPLKWTIIIDLIPILYCGYYDYNVLILKYCIQSGNVLGTVFSLYSFVTVYFLVLLIVWRAFWKKGLKEISLIPSTALLDNQSHDY